MNEKESTGTQAIQILREKNFKKVIMEIEKRSLVVVFDAKQLKKNG